MAIFQQNLPASLRVAPPAPQENRDGQTADRRPYLVDVPSRRIFAQTRKTVTSTRQFLALFPHEPEDARITGTTRSLYRRLLALNLPRTSARADATTEMQGESRFTLVDIKIA
jgi:hypothetical protein